MTVRIYSIFDSKVEAYLQPFFAPNNAVARRNFQSAASDATSNFHKFAGDYTLFFIAEFDDQTGQINRKKNHENLGTALEAITALNTQHIKEAI